MNIRIGDFVVDPNGEYGSDDVMQTDLNYLEKRFLELTDLRYSRCLDMDSERIFDPHCDFRDSHIPGHAFKNKTLQELKGFHSLDEHAIDELYIFAVIDYIR